MINGKNNLPLVSIVVLNYNGLDYLRETLPPLLAIDYKNYEIIVVDNHSEDDSLKYLFSVAAPGLKIIQNTENEGYCQGKNLGVKKASGEFILLLDEDIKIDAPTIINELLELYRNLQDPGFISLLLKEKEDANKTKLYGGFIRLFSIYSNKPLPIKNLMMHHYHLASSPDGGAIFFRKEVFIELGGFDTTQPYYLDVGDLGLRASLFGYRTHVYDKRVFEHLGTARKQNKESWLWKYGYHFSGISRVMFKNYRCVNLLVSYPYFCVFSILKMAVNVIRYKDLRVIARLLFSIGLFIKNIKAVMNERRKIQSKRIMHKDIFLHINQPL